MSNNEKDAWGQLLASKPSLEEVKAYFKGKGGGPEGESHIIDANADKKEGFVWVYSTKSDATKIIERCGDAILDYGFLDGQGVQLKIDRKAFRGIHCAFRNVK
jgi:hypothetical protein|tara:strand:+ start:2837 stop:3145 length:309 start_codon:yes stop_codon:yes gene_type:complete